MGTCSKGFVGSSVSSLSTSSLEECVKNAIKNPEIVTKQQRTKVQIQKKPKILTKIALIVTT